jgi:thioredoxin-dependent peroxiredoxin
MGAFKKMGYGLAGVSKDSQQSHAKFAAKLGLGYPLLVDEEKRLMTDLGAWGEKKMYGKVSMGAIRSTFVSDAKGKLVKVYPKVKAKGHAEQVLNDLA